MFLGLVIYGNGIDLTNAFKNESANFSLSDSNLVLFRLNGSLNALFRQSGKFFFHVTIFDSVGEYVLLYKCETNVC